VIAVSIDAAGAELAVGLVSKRLADLSAPFTKIGQSVLEDARAQIVSQGRAFADGAWAPMSELTSIVSTRLYGAGRDPNTLLQATRGLLESLTPGGSANIFEVTPKTASFGSARVSDRNGFPVAAAQQQGTSRTFHVLQGRGFSAVGIPARPFLSFRPEKVETYELLLAEHVLGADA
jgi:hypothetical protein